MYGAGSDLHGAQRLRAEGVPLPADHPLTRRARRLPPSLARRRAISRARRLLPAVAAAIAGAITAGFLPGLMLGVAVALVALPLQRFPLPLNLLPITRFTLALAPPAIGCGAFALASLLATRSLELAPVDAVIAGAAGMVVALAIEAIAPSAMRGLPVRIATLGSPGLAEMLRCELTETGIDEAEIAGWIDARGPNEIRDVVLAQRIDLIALDARSLTRIDGIGILAGLPVRALSSDEVYASFFGHIPPAETEPKLLEGLMDHDLGFRRSVGSRAAERLSASALLALGSPALLAGAASSWFRFDGTAFIRETRIGAGGEEITVLRLRSGSFSGLLQLVNVARGEMTFAGPPAEPEESIAALERRTPGFDRRALPAPGIAGWSRLRCGDETSGPDVAWRLAHEMAYAPRRSAVVDALLSIECMLAEEEPRLRPPARLLGPEPATVHEITEPAEPVVFGRARRAASGESGLAA